MIPINLEEYRVVFIVVALTFSLIAASPLLAVNLNFQSNSEKFSEFWLLGPNHVAGDYPFAVTNNDTYTIFVDLANHRGSSEYYSIRMKLRNTADSVFDPDTSQPSSLPALYDFRTVINDNATSEFQVKFGLEGFSLNNNVLTVDSLVINDFVLSVDKTASWNSEYSGYYLQLFFELWRYDVQTEDFVYENQVLGIWLNMTISE